MYFSKLNLNPRSRDVRRDLADCQQLHRTLLSAFPKAESDAARKEFGLLFRVETNLRLGTVNVLVQSKAQPDWTKLPSDRTGEPYNLQADCKAAFEHYKQLSDGMHLRFRLRANPVRRVLRPRDKVKNEDLLIGKRVNLQTEEEQLEWLQRKGEVKINNGKKEGGGFRLHHVQIRTDTSNNIEIPNVSTQSEIKLSGWRTNPRTGKRDHLRFGSVLFEGELEITDAEQFCQALRDGIGTGKAYGFGLLSIAPVVAN